MIGAPPCELHNLGDSSSPALPLRAHTPQHRSRLQPRLPGAGPVDHPAAICWPASVSAHKTQPPLRGALDGCADGTCRRGNASQLRHPKSVMTQLPARDLAPMQMSHLQGQRAGSDTTEATALGRKPLQQHRAGSSHSSVRSGALRHQNLPADDMASERDAQGTATVTASASRRATCGWWHTDETPPVSQGSAGAKKPLRTVFYSSNLERDPSLKLASAIAGRLAQESCQHPEPLLLSQFKSLSDESRTEQESHDQYSRELDSSNVHHINAESSMESSELNSKMVSRKPLAVPGHQLYPLHVAPPKSMHHNVVLPYRTPGGFWDVVK